MDDEYLQKTGDTSVKLHQRIRVRSSEWCGSRSSYFSAHKIFSISFLASLEFNALNLQSGATVWISRCAEIITRPSNQMGKEVLVPFPADDESVADQSAREQSEE